VVTGHLAAANPQCQQFEGGPALAVFSGPHAYIAPGWYKTQPAVPTWDYAAVHLHGTLDAVHEHMDAHGEMLDALQKDDPTGFDVRNLAEKYRAMMFKGIRAFRLRATKIEAQWKMSQNRSIEDRKGVIEGLTKQGLTDIAAMVAETIPAE
jgi:transcriptional regulator